MYKFACWPSCTFMQSSGGSNMWARFAFPILTHMYREPKKCYWQRRIMYLLHSTPELETSVSILTCFFVWSFLASPKRSPLNCHTVISFFFPILNVLVWRHVDKTGPEGNIDSLMLHGQGNIDVTIYLWVISVPLCLVVNSLNYILL